ncbi:hypothetical protein CDAR_7981 [Caerostris darwini]|uniref:Ycf15 n=1 Tax=Caerostris darwini TaxID=1538125 RepID=A0AAV4V2M6_9ARAC|nr:hypothetical protein CDAR_7981 [Caerostris darwini]
MKTVFFAKLSQRRLKLLLHGGGTSPIHCRPLGWNVLQQGRTFLLGPVCEYLHPRMYCSARLHSSYYELRRVNWIKLARIGEGKEFKFPLCSGSINYLEIDWRLRVYCL